jgi:hypothetical protein
MMEFEKIASFRWKTLTENSGRRMNSKHSHAPVAVNPQRKRCPVCHQAVYSLAGIHPQCAMSQSDPPRVKAKKPVPSAVAEPVAVESADGD